MNVIREREREREREGHTGQGNHVFGRETLCLKSINEIAKGRKGGRDDPTVGSRKACCFRISSSKLDIPFGPTELNNVQRVSGN